MIIPVSKVKETKSLEEVNKSLEEGWILIETLKNNKNNTQPATITYILGYSKKSQQRI